MLEQLFHVGVHFVLVEEDLVGAHRVHQLDPLGKPHCEVVGDVESFHTNRKLLLLLSLLQLIVGDFQEDGGCLAWIFHNGHQNWVFVGVAWWNGTGEEVRLKVGCRVVSFLASLLADKEVLVLVDKRKRGLGAVLKPELTKYLPFWPQLVKHTQEPDAGTLRVPGSNVKVGSVEIEGDGARDHLLPI